MHLNLLKERGKNEGFRLHCSFKKVLARPVGSPGTIVSLLYSFIVWHLSDCGIPGVFTCVNQ